MKISIIGGGNIGTWLAGEWSAAGHEVCVYTQRPELWGESIEVMSSDGAVICTGKPAKVTANLKDAVEFGAVVLVTWPAHVRPALLREMGLYVDAGKIIAIMPGTGGVEFEAGGILEKGAILCGFQRVASIARVKEYGKSVFMLGRKKELFMSALNSRHSEQACALFSQLLQIPCRALKNYLEVTLTPSNPILHTARICQLFENYRPGVVYKTCPLFYEEWEDKASEYMLGADAELQTFCSHVSSIGLDLRGVLSLKNYYGAPTPALITKKLQGIPAFRGIKSPMVAVPHGFIPDLSSRFFLEDFPFGLCIVKGFCELGGIRTPFIDHELHWFQNLTGRQYFQGESYSGSDLAETGMPQRYGFRSVQEVVKFYSR